MIHLLYGRGIIQRSNDHVPKGEAEEGKQGSTAEEKTGLPFQGQEKEGEEFFTGARLVRFSPVEKKDNLGGGNSFTPAL